MEGLTIRNMTKEDVMQVQSVASRCFSTPWPSESFEYELSNKDAILKVAVANTSIAGYICLRTLLDITHVLDIAVIPRMRRAGIGSLLMNGALQELKTLRQDVTIVTLEVRESNIAAIGLYEKFGFKEIGRRKGYYRKPVEDALIMELDITATGASLTFH